MVIITNMFNKYSKIIKFSLVGVLNTVIFYAFYYLFSIIGLTYLASYCISYCFGVINSYLLNNFWVFSDNQKSHIQKFMVFITITLAVLLFSEIVLYLFVDLIGINKYISGLLIIPVTLILNYLGYKLFVFKK